MNAESLYIKKITNGLSLWQYFLKSSVIDR